MVTTHTKHIFYKAIPGTVYDNEYYTPPAPHRRIHEQVREPESLKVLLFPDERRKQNAPFFYPC